MRNKVVGNTQKIGLWQRQFLTILAAVVLAMLTQFILAGLPSADKERRAAEPVIMEALGVWGAREVQTRSSKAYRKSGKPPSGLVPYLAEITHVGEAYAQYADQRDVRGTVMVIHEPDQVEWRSFEGVWDKTKRTANILRVTEGDNRDYARLRYVGFWDVQRFKRLVGKDPNRQWETRPPMSSQSFLEAAQVAQARATARRAIYAHLGAETTDKQKAITLLTPVVQFRYPFQNEEKTALLPVTGYYRFGNDLSVWFAGDVEVRTDSDIGKIESWREGNSMSAVHRNADSTPTSLVQENPILHEATPRLAFFVASPKLDRFRPRHPLEIRGYDVLADVSRQHRAPELRALAEKKYLMEQAEPAVRSVLRKRLGAGLAVHFDGNLRGAISGDWRKQAVVRVEGYGQMEHLSRNVPFRYDALVNVTLYATNRNDAVAVLKIKRLPSSVAKTRP